jgi:signal peptidase
MSREDNLLHKFVTLIEVVLCIIMIPVLAINVVLIVKCYVNQEKVPDIGGFVPLIVLTDSMEPDIQNGDLVICRTKKADSVEVGDVIAFYDPAGSGTSIVTHEVVELVTENGSIKFRTKGIANNREDASLVPVSNFIGVLMIRLPKLGKVAMFMQTPAGIVVCIAIPLLLIIGYDCVRHILYDKEFEKNREKETEEFIAELEKLRAEKRGMNENGEK